MFCFLVVCVVGDLSCVTLGVLTGPLDDCSLIEVEPLPGSTVMRATEAISDLEEHDEDLMELNPNLDHSRTDLTVEDATIKYVCLIDKSRTA